MNTIVVAGAGTGKTYALVQEYLLSLFGLDDSGVKKHPTQMLAVTFTEKAAAEMRTRVTSKLLQIARNGMFDDEIVERARCQDLALPSSAELRIMSRGLLSAPICTFHSFCSQILREHATAAGIDAGFSLLSPGEENELALEIAESVVLDALSQDAEPFGHLVARFQLRRLGETKGLAENLVSLYQEIGEHGVSAMDVRFPFTNVEGDLRDDARFAKHIDDIQNSLGNFERMPKLTETARQRLERVKSALQGLLAILENDDELEVRLSATFRELRQSVSGRFGSDDLRQPLVDAIVGLGSFLCHALTCGDANSVRYLLQQFGARFDEYKERFGVFGFGDLLKRARILLRDNVAVRQSVKERFQRILVDEFQDTSPLQEDLVALLCEDRNAQTSLSANERAMSVLPLQENALFVVGDPKQSIYSFRGADVTLFEHTLRKVTDPSEEGASKGQRKSLQLCRRSQGAIVELVNQVAAATLFQSGDGIAFGDEDVLQALKPAKRSAGAIWKVEVPVGLDKEIESARAIAGEVKNLIDGEISMPKDIAVLVRRIKTAVPIVRELQRLGVPARIFGGDGFYTRPEVMDILAALKLVVDPDDELATLTVLRSPLAALPDNDLVAVLDNMSHWRRGVCFSQIADSIENAPVELEVKNRIRSLSDLLSNIRSRLGEISVAQAIDMLLDEGHYTLAIAVEPDADDRLANLTKLRAMCMHDRANASTRINKLWNLLDDPPKESLADPLDAQPNAVQVMTIHQSKGLEYDVVVLADTWSTLRNESDDIAFDPEAGLAISHKGRPISVCAPDKSEEKKSAPTPIDVVRQKKRRRAEAEMARLLYVALTRAKEFIYVVDVQIEGEQSIDRGISLRRLLYQGRESNPSTFDNWLPTQIIKSPTSMAVVDVQRQELTRPQAFDEQPSMLRRVLGSQILPRESVHRNTRRATTELGSLAHRMIALVGTHLRPRDTSEQDIRGLLEAAARALGISRKVSSTQDVMDACVRTLAGPILHLLQDDYSLHFEEPIFGLQEGWALEGTADLVARNNSKIIVVDFKSSHHGAQSRATWLQLFAYAAALKKQNAMPVLVTPCVIGDGEPLMPKPYDNNTKEQLLDALKAHAPVAMSANP